VDAVGHCTFVSRVISMFVFDILQICSRCIQICSGCIAPTHTSLAMGLVYTGSVSLLGVLIAMMDKFIHDISGSIHMNEIKSP
jgi:hypothetical protein